MAFLGSFEYDIFLSYGWAGNRTPEEGDRAWIRAFKDLLVERLRTQLGRAPTIFLDSQAERSGALGEALESAVESSAFLLFAMSPGSCRPDSWCQAEVRHFLGRARPLAAKDNVLTAEERILGIMFEPVARAGQPPLLANMGFRPYELFDELESGPPRLTRPADLAEAGESSAGLEFERLLKETSNRLGEAQTILTRQQPASGVTVFAGSAPTGPLDQRCAAVLRRELLIRGHRVLTDEPIPSESEDNYRLRLETALANAQISVHLLNETAPVVAGWKRSPIAWQIRKAVQASSVALFSWLDQDASSMDAGAKLELDECKSEGNHHFEKQNFETFKAAVLKRADELARALVDAAPARPVVHPIPSPAPTNSAPVQTGVTPAPVNPAPLALDKLVVVAFDTEDRERAERIRDNLFDRGLEAQLTLEPGPGAGERKRQNTKYFKRADGVLVYFGESCDDLWLQTTCDLVRDNMRPEGHRVVVVGPPLDKPRLKERLREPEFECCRTASGDDIAFIDAWLQQLAGVAAKPAVSGS